MISYKKICNTGSVECKVNNGSIELSAKIKESILKKARELNLKDEIKNKK